MPQSAVKRPDFMDAILPIVCLLAQVSGRNRMERTIKRVPHGKYALVHAREHARGHASFSDVGL